MGMRIAPRMASTSLPWNGKGGLFVRRKPSQGPISGTSWWRGKTARATALVNWSATRTRVKTEVKRAHERGRGGRMTPKPTGRSW